MNLAEIAMLLGGLAMILSSLATHEHRQRAEILALLREIRDAIVERGEVDESLNWP